jgi:hypothetical protein
MTYWYEAVCDEHKEYCSIFVIFNEDISLYCIDTKMGAEFLYKHEHCKLRLVSEFERDNEQNGSPVIPDDYKEYKGEQK